MRLVVWIHHVSFLTFKISLSRGEYKWRILGNKSRDVDLSTLSQSHQLVAEASSGCVAYDCLARSYYNCASRERDSTSCDLALTLTSSIVGATKVNMSLKKKMQHS